ncbi:hypothetical protein D3C85_1417140 [compost metagenome]
MQRVHLANPFREFGQFAVRSAELRKTRKVFQQATGVRRKPCTVQAQGGYLVEVVLDVGQFFPPVLQIVTAELCRQIQCITPINGGAAFAKDAWFSFEAFQDPVCNVLSSAGNEIDLLFGQSGIKILHAFFQGRWHPGDHGPPKKGDCFRGCDRANRWFK